MKVVVTFNRTRQPLSEGDIKDIEGQLGISIPTDLREHYLRYNGSRPDPRFLQKDGEWYGVQDFLPMKANDKNIGFEDTYKDLVFSTPEFPKAFIPFAIDEAGDYFLYSIESGKFGEIAFNQSDYVDDPQRFIVYLCDTLTNFIGSLSNPD